MVVKHVARFRLAADFEGVGSTLGERDQVSRDEVKAGAMCYAGLGTPVTLLTRPKSNFLD